MEKKRNPARVAAITGVFGAMALALSIFESFLPAIPMLPPGAKLGLSNIVTMYIGGSLGLGPALLIAAVKGIFSGITRGFTAFIMSFFGGVFSTFVMWLCFKINKIGYIGIGVCGALTHNAVQLLAAYFITSKSVLWYAPWLLIFSIITGSLSGLLMKTVMPILMKLHKE